MEVTPKAQGAPARATKVVELQVLVTDCLFAGNTERAAWHFHMIGRAVRASEMNVCTADAPVAPPRAAAPGARASP